MALLAAGLGAWLVSVAATVPPDFPGLIAQGACWAGAGAAAWYAGWSLLALVGTFGRAGSPHLMRLVLRGAPAIVRRLVWGSTGVVLAVAAASSPALALPADLGYGAEPSRPEPTSQGAPPTQPEPEPTVPPNDTGASSANPTPLPDLNPTPSPRAPGTGAALEVEVQSVAAASQHYTVRPGDTLWSISQHFGASSAAEAAAAWPLLWEANRSIIGPDPDVIHPGMVLTVPAFDEE